jgi:hypothetical protein
MIVDVDIPTGLIAAFVVLCMLFIKKNQEPYIISIAAILAHLSKGSR